MTTAVAPLPAQARLARADRARSSRSRSYVGAFLAVDGWPGLGEMIWVTVAMVGARTLAMALNRLVDAELDARNPRTAGRELPSGGTDGAGRRSGAQRRSRVPRRRLPARSHRAVWPIPVVRCSSSTRTSSASRGCATWLGACLGLAPVGAWLVVRDSAMGGMALGAAVLCWVAGFDLFLPLRPRARPAGGAPSWAARFGERGSSSAPGLFTRSRRLLVARQALAVGAFYWLGVAAVAGLLGYEHSLVGPVTCGPGRGVLHVNGVISLVFLGGRHSTSSSQAPPGLSRSFAS